MSFDRNEILRGHPGLHLPKDQLPVDGLQFANTVIKSANALPKDEEFVKSDAVEITVH